MALNESLGDHIDLTNTDSEDCEAGGRVPYQPQLHSAVRYRPAAASQLLAFQYCFHLVQDRARARRAASHPKLAPS